MTNKKILVGLMIALFLVGIVNVSAGKVRVDSITYSDGSHKVSSVSEDFAVASAMAESNLCYELIGGFLPDNTLDFYVNPSNDQGLSEKFILSTTKKAVKTWDKKVSGRQFNSPIVDYSINDVAEDGFNVVVFEKYTDPYVLALTSAWYDSTTFELLEFDQIYNTDYMFGDARKNSEVFDLQSLMTHEFGHVFGLADIYTDSCKDVVMYVGQLPGDISKRSLTTSEKVALSLIYN